MPETTIILVEGLEDKQFLEAYLKHLHLGVGEYTIEQTGGKDKKSFLREKVERAVGEELNVLVVFDANSTPATSRASISEHLENLPQNIFLFPDNQSNGDLETLLEQITKPEHKAILDCFEEYKKCISKKGYKPPSRKAKIYSYQFSLELRKEERDRKSEHYDLDYWNFDHAALEPLKRFLTTHLA